MRTKLCRTCGKIRALRFFHFKSVSKGTRSAWCRSCRSSYGKRHYLANHDTYIRKARKWNDKNRFENRQRVLEHLYKHPCVDCGESNPVILTFDHVIGKKHDEISNMIRLGKTWPTIEEEIKKCDVRCANCHMHKTSKERKWWKASECARKQRPRKTSSPQGQDSLASAQRSFRSPSAVHGSRKSPSS
jgi:hypothetical protein